TDASGRCWADGGRAMEVSTIVHAATKDVLRIRAPAARTTRRSQYIEAAASIDFRQGRIATGADVGEQLRKVATLPCRLEQRVALEPWQTRKAGVGGSAQ